MLDVKQPARLLLNAELRPCEGFANLFQSAVAAGQSDESVPQISHQCLTLMHSSPDVKFRHAAVTNPATHQSFGNHAYAPTPFCKRCVRQNSHQTDATAAKHN